jgi:hypothetical protein
MVSHLRPPEPCPRKSAGARLAAAPEAGVEALRGLAHGGRRRSTLQPVAALEEGRSGLWGSVAVGTKGGVGRSERGGERRSEAGGRRP